MIFAKIHAGLKRQLGEIKQRYTHEKEVLLTEISDLKKETQELRSTVATKEAEHEQWLGKGVVSIAQKHSCS